uniref:LOX4 n=1 Tax=Arundo donax TaxID=35708 RepID=A0A0A9CL23_ARUDO
MASSTAPSARCTPRLTPAPRAISGSLPRLTPALTTLPGTSLSATG